MITRKIKLMLTASITSILFSAPAHANMDADANFDMDATQKVMEMIVDLGGHGSFKNNGKLVACDYRGTRKVSIIRDGDSTTYHGEYRNCRAKGSIRDGIYTVTTEGEFITDSSSQRSINGELFDAAVAGDVDKVRALIKAKADVNYTESVRSNDGKFVDEWSPLMSSVATGKLEITKLLVEAGAWVNYLNSNVFNSLWLAANTGQLDMVTYLAGKHAYINNLSMDDISPLMGAAMNGHYAVVEYLAGLKAELNFRNRNGDNALMLALQNGHTPIARLLINRGAEINNRNVSGATALMIAVVESNEEIVRLLLEHKVDVTPKSGSGKTALDYATLKGNAVVLDLIKKAQN